MKTQFDITKSKNDFNGLHFTTNHSAKMAGVCSISTDINKNPICQMRQKNGVSICSKCFSAKMWNPTNGVYRKAVTKLSQNTDILTTRIIPISEMPKIDYNRFPICRIESFGDIQNPTQVINYFNLCKANPQIRFGFWTKNPGFIATALKYTTKPQNCNIVLSSFKLNKPAKGNFDFIDKIFSVYDKETIQRENIDINCGARSCLLCQRCYKANPNGEKIEHIREMLK